MQTHIRQRHGRKGQATEYYEWSIPTPKVVVQKYGERWFLGITHTDGTWQVAAYYDGLADAKRIAERLAQRYASAGRAGTSEDVRLAITTVHEFAHPPEESAGIFAG